MAAHRDKTIINRTKKGFSLIEVVISAMLFVLVWLVLAENILVGKASEVRSRHHVQAAYFAQSYIEQVLRQKTFSVPLNEVGTLLAMKNTNPNQLPVTVGAENAATQFNAILFATINPIVYNGTGTTSPMYANVTIDIQWNESPVIGGGGILQHEYIMTIIPNDTIGN